MELNLLVVVVIAVTFITLSYKFLPFRETGAKRPLLAILPKYKKLVNHSLTDAQLEEKLAEFGFKKTKQIDSVSRFSRGSVLGDISIKLAKVNVALREISTGVHEVTVQAGWVAAFDTGDHWQFITELAGKIEDA